MALAGIEAMPSIKNVNNISFNLEQLVDKTESKSNVFDDIYQAAIGMVDKVGDYQLAAEAAQLDFASGKTDDMLAVMVAQEKAYYALNFTVQVVNKAIEAYKEIMRIQL